jgi:hypothetical protein
VDDSPDPHKHKWTWTEPLGLPGQFVDYCKGCGQRKPTPNDAEPRTEAGRRLLAREAYNSRSFALITAEAICAIEDEAAQMPARAEEVERLDRPGNRADGRRV